MKPEDFDPNAVETTYDDLLKRSHTYKGPRTTIASIRYEAKQAGYQAPASKPTYIVPNSGKINLDDFVPQYEAAGLPPREFVGPRVGEARLFPLNALSIFVALGAGGKTSSVMAMAAHIASGKTLLDQALKQRRVTMFFVEEEQLELNRKFSAIVQEWTDAERREAQKNLRLVSLTNHDPRITHMEGRGIVEAPFVDQIIELTVPFGAELIVCDHLQGFTSGDLNNSDTATVLARAANRIVSQTGAAVVFTAHTSKANIRAEAVEVGFVTGSLAFENAARQVTGIIRMPDSDAKRWGLEATCDQYIKVQMPKNSYGPANQIAYLKKEYVPDFHTVKIVPWQPPTGTSLFVSAEDRLSEAIMTAIKGKPGVTRNQIDQMSGEKNTLKASKDKVRRAIERLLSKGVLEEVVPTEEQRKSLGMRQQARKFLRIADD
jgi:RecA-family ATPase